MRNNIIKIVVFMIPLIMALISMQPEEWAYNIMSWREILFIIAIVVLVSLMSYFIIKYYLTNGYIMIFENRSITKLKKILENELENTKSIIAIGVACDELSKKPFEFWKRFFIERDGKLKIMFADPHGVQIGLREEMVCGSDGGDFSSSISYNMRILTDNLKKISSNKDIDDIRGQIKCHPFAPAINCIVTDNYVFFHHYGSSTRGINMPIYVVKKNKNKTNVYLYNFYKDMLDELWKKTYSLRRKLECHTD